LRAAVDGQTGVTVDDLYENYPDFLIDGEREQRRLLEHDVIVFQHPMYWYSAPALLKEWQDAVLELGFAYGEGGDKLHGKRFMQAVTTGAPHGSYRHGGKAHFEIPELLRPFEQMAHYCGMSCLPPFITHRARVAAERDLEAQAQRYLTLIEQLVDGELPAPFDTIRSAE
jgi:glutathione-regulated potassium-efflux system ancillary protein KefG